MRIQTSKHRLNTKSRRRTSRRTIHRTSRRTIHRTSRRSRRSSRVIKTRRTALTIKNSPDPVVSVIIPIMNERRTLAQVIYNTSKVHPRTEVIVVINGSKDGSEQIARRVGAKVRSYSRPLGHDVGRSIGAMEAQGSILLFVDGDFIIPTSELIPFVAAIEQGQDIALNGYSGPTQKQNVHNVVAAKHALNIALFRPDLYGASMTTVPHAMSRKALELIGAHQLSIPPLAHAIAIHKGLKISNQHVVNVGPRNPRRRRGKHEKDPLEQLIVGDHLEAMHWLLQNTNRRGNHTDLTRLRDRVR